MTQFSLGLGLTSSPRSLMAATRLAATNIAPSGFGFCALERLHFSLWIGVPSRISRSRYRNVDQQHEHVKSTGAIPGATMGLPLACCPCGSIAQQVTVQPHCL